jgi:hypothetical protein
MAESPTPLRDFAALDARFVKIYLENHAIDSNRKCYIRLSNAGRTIAREISAALRRLEQIACAAANSRVRQIIRRERIRPFSVSS